MTSTEDENKKINRRKDAYSKEARLIHGEMETPVWDYSHNVVPPLSANSTFRLDTSTRGNMGFLEYAQESAGETEGRPIFIYDRLEEPTAMMLENRLAEVEQGDAALVFASGMAAISTLALSLLKQGENIVSHPTLYGCTDSLFREWLPRWGIEARRVDMNDLEAVESACDDLTRLLYLETPLNPTLDLMDIDALSGLAKRLNENRSPETQIRVAVDNTFQTPWGQRPLSLGADIVAHSLTKGIAGFGTDTAGALVFGEDLKNDLLVARKDLGGMLSPRATWHILTYGISTLGVRFQAQQSSAGEVAAYLERHPKVSSVRWPGLESFPQKELARRQMVDSDGAFCPGFMIYFTLKGACDDTIGQRFVDSVAEEAYAITLAVSLGNIRTLIECPYSMTHACVPEDAKGSVSLTPGGIRLSVGLESPRDLIRDLSVALDTL